MRNYSFLKELDDPFVKREAFRELGKTDLYFLCKYILGYSKLETRTSIHYTMCDRLDKLDNIESYPGSTLREFDLMFRGSFKTSIALGKIIQWLIRDKNAQIGIGSDIDERAQERVLVLRDMINTNEFLKDLYPDVFFKNGEAESGLWTKHAFNIKRDANSLSGGGFTKPSVSSFGLFPLPVGSHYTHVYLDDIENESNTNTEELTTQLVQRVSGFIPTLRPTAPVLMSGTIYSERGPNTVYQTRWPTYKIPIVDKYGKPTFPSVFSESAIKQLRVDIADEWYWQGQYMMRYVPRTDNMFFPFSGVKLQEFVLYA